jgi:hypothetical protein
MATASVAGQRWAAVLILLVLGILSLPMAAAPFGEDDNENWIIVVAVALMVLVGLVVGALRPGLAGPNASRARGARVGAVVGVAMLVLGVVVFFLLLSGFDGA